MVPLRDMTGTVLSMEDICITRTRTDRVAAQQLRPCNPRPLSRFQDIAVPRVDSGSRRFLDSTPALISDISRPTGNGSRIVMPKL